MSVAAPPPEAWSEWGGGGPQLVFAHANGFPPATYKMLFDELNSRFEVMAFAARPLWPGCNPFSIHSWIDLAGDLRSAMRQRALQQAIGVGHSLGGVLAIMAAAAEPSLFSALALVDPVVFSGRRALFWGIFKHFGFGHRLPLIRSARRRRERFPNLNAVRSAYAGKSVFSTWEPRALDDYIRAGFVEKPDGGVVLRYSRGWEAGIFELTPASVWSHLRRVRVPMLFVRGGASDTFLPGAANRAERELPNATVVELSDTTHFLPMERPAQVAQLIVDWQQRI